MEDPRLINIAYKFWPIGQGLFATGLLSINGRDKPFHWVYDCGTTSKQKYLKVAMTTYQTEQFAGDSRPKIDLVTISHFDNDHISGLVDLLSKFAVKTLLLPYVPLWQRLLIAFEEGLDSQSDLMRFFISPADYIVSIEGAEIDEILFVQPSGNDGPAVNSQEGANPSPTEDHGGWDIQTVRTDGRSGEQKDEIGKSKRRNTKVSFSGDTLFVAGVWEFVPYNDAEVLQRGMPIELSDFQNQVKVLRDELLGSPSTETLGKLKDLYDEQFGSDSEPRNVISLFLYGGPIGHKKPHRKLIDRWTVVGENGHWQNRMHYWSHLDDGFERVGVLYTGDGYLDTPPRFESLRTYLKDARVQEISCLQVMHHGAEDNWHKGLAKKFSPDISVFSSDPTHRGYKHPHGSVVRDFLKYTPVQVDKTDGLEIEIRLYP